MEIIAQGTRRSGGVAVWLCPLRFPTKLLFGRACNVIIYYFKFKTVGLPLNKSNITNKSEWIYVSIWIKLHFFQKSLYECGLKISFILSSLGSYISGKVDPCRYKRTVSASLCRYSVLFATLFLLQRPATATRSFWVFRHRGRDERLCSHRWTGVGKQFPIGETWKRFRFNAVKTQTCLFSTKLTAPLPRHP